MGFIPPASSSGVKTFSKSGATKLKGNVTLSQGTNVTLTQTGNDISIAASGGGVATDTIWDAKGDLVAATGADTATKLTLGTDGYVLTADSAQTNGVKWAAGTGTSSFVYNETPSGTVNGSNTAFTTASAPVSGTLQVFRDGQLMAGGGADYSLSGSTITFTTAPATSSVLLVTYQSVASTAGNADTVDGLSATQYGNNSGILIANYLGWLDLSNTTWTYSSVDGATGIVTINADLTAYIQAGDRIKFTQTTVKYFIVTKTPTFGAGVTTLTFWGGTDYTLANASISAPFFSRAKSPFGFNTDPTKWSIRLSHSTDYTQATPTSNTWYNIGTTNNQMTIHIGVWLIRGKAEMKSDFSVATGQAEMAMCLSAANNSASDSDMLGEWYIAAPASLGVSQMLYIPNKTLTLTSKTTYYLNAKTYVAAGSISNMYIFGATGSSVDIRATCAYL